MTSKLKRWSPIIWDSSLPLTFLWLFDIVVPFLYKYPELRFYIIGVNDGNEMRKYYWSINRDVLVDTCLPIDLFTSTTLHNTNISALATEGYRNIQARFTFLLMMNTTTGAYLPQSPAHHRHWGLIVNTRANS